MSNYYICFKGQYDVIEHFLKNKISSINIKLIQENKAIAIVDNADELYYYKNFTIDDFTQITEIEQTLEQFPSEDLFAKAEIFSNEITKSVILDYRFNLNSALINATLKSKSPLQPDDPFNYILGKDYLLYSSFIIALILLISNLF